MIAAGEVIESPYSVVKELVENAIDAKSTIIEINLLESGMKMVEVIDNGIGMTPADAKMAFFRHATSKIKNEFDLFRINSLGFRGEAIPSIASVSEFILKTKQSGDEGFEVIYKAGKLLSEKRCAMNKGTHIKVNNLFFNTPARLKYMKNLHSELTKIIDLIEKFAIANPFVFFKLSADKKVLFQTSGKGDLAYIINQIYGLEVFKNLKFFESSFDNIRMSGYLSNRNLYKAKTSFIVLLVNNRIVKNKEIIEAIIESYQPFIPVSRFPVVIFSITIDSIMIDVNVSPAKTEIKFSNTELIVQFINKTISEIIVKEIKEVFNEEKPDNQINYVKHDFKNVLEKEEKPIYQEKINNNLFNFEANSIKEDIHKEHILKDDLSYIGQFSGTYLLFQNTLGLWLFDQHACAERIKYEYYKKKLSEDNKMRQELLFPLNLEFPLSQFLQIKENLFKINNLGFVLEESGPKSFFLREVPLYILHEDLDETLERLLNFILSQKSFDIKDIIDETAKLISCKNSIKANKFLSDKEVLHLLGELEKCETPYFCPHGRPTYIKLSQLDIEKLFRRVV